MGYTGAYDTGSSPGDAAGTMHTGNMTLKS